MFVCKWDGVVTHGFISTRPVWFVHSNRCVTPVISYMIAHTCIPPRIHVKPPALIYQDAIKSPPLGPIPVNPFSSNHHSRQLQRPASMLRASHTNISSHSPVTITHTLRLRRLNHPSHTDNHTNVFPWTHACASAPLLAASTDTSTTVATVTATTGINYRHGDMQSEGATIKAWLTSFWGARLKFPRAAANWISLHTQTHRKTERGWSGEAVMLKHHLREDTHTKPKATHTQIQTKATIHTYTDI